MSVLNDDNLPYSRKRAKALGFKYYNNGSLCKKGHRGPRYTSKGSCVCCHYEERKEWAKNNNEHLLEYTRVYGKEYRHKNYIKVAASRAIKQKRFKLATPLWADLIKIKDMYVLAKRLTMETGVAHQVDHFVPLNGRKVCGLHVHTNLRIIRRDINIRKGNKWRTKHLPL